MKVSWLKFLNLMEDIKEKYERIFKNENLKILSFYKFTIVYLTKYGGRDKNNRKWNFYWTRRKIFKRIIRKIAFWKSKRRNKFRGKWYKNIC